jgi:citrate synthase
MGDERSASLTVRVSVKNGTQSPDEARECEVLESATEPTIAIAARDVALTVQEATGTHTVCYDSGYLNTVMARSSITYIDGEQGIMRYRGIPIEQLAEQSSFLEVAFLLIFGDLPSKGQLDQFSKLVADHSFLHTDICDYMRSFRYDAHPMGIFISSMAALATTIPAGDLQQLDKHMYRILGQASTIAANAYRHRIGRAFNEPRMDLGYTENFLYMLDRLSERDYRPHPAIVRALDILWIVHADHELNCSTACMRHLTSARVDPYTAISGAASALFGPSHGGAAEAVVRQLERIQTIENIEPFLERVKAKEERLFGFGHRVYKSFDPRARILKEQVEKILELVKVEEPLFLVAKELEQRALQDEYFRARRLYPNVDFYSGVIYRALGFPTDFYPLLFAIPRIAGWLAHSREAQLAEAQLDVREHTHVVRPAQVYTGSAPRPFVSLEAGDRPPYQGRDIECYRTRLSTRRRLGLLSDSSASAHTQHTHARV